MIHIDPATLVSLVVALGPTRCDVAAVRDALGDSQTDSLATVARAFGITVPTIKGWRQAGLPGDARARRYVWCDCLCWWLEREAKRSKTKNNGADDRARKELEHIEVETAKANLQFRQARAAKWSDEFVSRRYVETEFVTALSVIKSTMLQVPDDIAPALPPESADQIRMDVTRKIHGALNAAAERASQAISIIDHEKENGAIANG